MSHASNQALVNESLSEPHEREPSGGARARFYYYTGLTLTLQPLVSAESATSIVAARMSSRISVIVPPTAVDAFASWGSSTNDSPPPIHQTVLPRAGQT